MVLLRLISIIVVCGFQCYLTSQQVNMRKNLFPMDSCDQSHLVPSTAAGDHNSALHTATLQLVPRNTQEYVPSKY